MLSQVGAFDPVPENDLTEKSPVFAAGVAKGVSISHSSWIMWTGTIFSRDHAKGTPECLDRTP